MVSFQTGPLFDQTWQNRSQNNPSLKTKLAQFLQVKSQDPTANFGASDKPFKSNGFFTNAIPKIKHAHLTHDLSLVYVLEGGADPVIRLYGVFSHDDLGTGTPANLNRQRNMASQFARQTFGRELGAPVATSQSGAVTKTASAKPDYTPKPARPAEPSRSAQVMTQSLVAAEQAWPQRNLARQFDNAGSKLDQLALLNRELAYLEAIANKHRLYPNQQQYARQVIDLYRSITAK